MAAALPPISRTTTGNTAFYSFADSNASTVHPDMSTAAATVPAAATTTTRRAPSDPSPDYHPAVNGSTAPVDAKVMPINEKHTAAGPLSEKETSPTTATTEPAGTSGVTSDVVAPTSPPSSPSREQQLSHHAVGTFAAGAVTAVCPPLECYIFESRNVFLTRLPPCRKKNPRP